VADFSGAVELRLLGQGLTQRLACELQISGLKFQMAGEFLASAAGLEGLQKPVRFAGQTHLIFEERGEGGVRQNGTCTFGTSVYIAVDANAS
jgi:hypothetical protein